MPVWDCSIPGFSVQVTVVENGFIIEFDGCDKYVAKDTLEVRKIIRDLMCTWHDEVHEKTSK